MHNTPSQLPIQEESMQKDKRDMRYMKKKDDISLIAIVTAGTTKVKCKFKYIVIQYLNICVLE